MPQKSKLLNPQLFFMKAVIICDDFVFSESAASTLARVGRQIGVNVQWITKCWPINALNDVKLAEDALTEAMDAHLIVFPARWANSLPSFVLEWLGHWAAVRNIPDAALGVIKVGNVAKQSFSDLLRLAQEHGLRLIVDDDPPKNAAGLSIHFQTEPEVAIPVPQTYLGELSLQGSCRGFGINE